MMSHFITPNRHCYSVKFSPSNPNNLAIVSSQNYGLNGGGTLFILHIDPNGTIIELSRSNWQDALYDIAWSGYNEYHVLTSSGDGTLQLWNLNFMGVPSTVFQGHHQEVCSIDWSRTKNAKQFLSASWDNTIKLWDPERNDPLCTYMSQRDFVHQAVFSPHVSSNFVSVGGDGFLKIWDFHNNKQPGLCIKAHDAEVLSCDWSKYDPNLLVTSGTDGLIRGWDRRNASQPVLQLKGHNSAIKKVQFSPHYANILASVSFDYATKIWDLSSPGGQNTRVLQHHTEFVYGLDWNPLRRGQLADCAWDSIVRVFSINFSQD